MPRYIYLLTFSLGIGGLVVLPVVLVEFVQFYRLELLLVAIVLLSLVVASLGFLSAGKAWVLRGVVLVIAYILGFTVGMHTVSTVMDKQLDARFEGVDITLEGIVSGLPRDSGHSILFDVHVTSAYITDTREPALQSSPAKVRLSIYKKTNDDWVTVPEVGSSWEFIVRMKRPRGLVNPGGFDFHAWLLSRGYVATGYIRSAERLEEPLQPFAFGLTSFKLKIHQTREALVTRFLSHPYEHGGLLKALLFGVKSDITPDQWEVLQATGTTHLMAISGLHIGLVAGIAFLLGRLVCGLVSYGLGSRAALWIPAMCSIVLAGCYAALAGFSLPTQRALMLVVALNVAHVFGVKTNFFNGLSLAAAVILVLDPFAFLNPGFWLSFVAVVVIIYGTGLDRGYPKWKGVLVGQWVVFVGLFVPLTALGLPVSLLSPVANLVAVTFVSLVLVPLLFLSLIFGLMSDVLGGFLFYLSDSCASFLWLFLKWISTFPKVVTWFAQGQSQWLVIGVGGVGTMLFLAPRGLAVRWLGAAALLVVIAPKSTENTRLKISVLDVGQGLAVVGQYQAFTFIYDTGDWYSNSFDIGSQVILPFLRRQSSDSVDLLVLSHGDKDHIGGYRSVANAISVAQVVFGPGITVQHDNREPCISGKLWQIDDLSIRVLYPNGLSVNTANKNNMSCVMLLEYRGFKMLFPGDIEWQAEQFLVDQYPNVNLDVLLAPHHGSKTSSSEAFIKSFDPEIVVMSAGYKNRYKHPHQEVIQRYNTHGIQSLNTAVEGAITITVNSEGQWQYTAERAVSRKLWF